MTIETAPRMTVAEIALMREIIAWRKAHGVVYSPTQGWWRDHENRCVARVTGPVEIGVTDEFSGATFEWHHVHSVTQAVDLLVALSYLPVEFSGAYRAGVDAGRQGVA